MTDRANLPLSHFDRPTARAVARAFKRAFHEHAENGLPYSAASDAAKIAYRALHPGAKDGEVLAVTIAIINAVDAEHPGWLFKGARPRPRDARHHHDAYERMRARER
ncbi:hypothetical protein [Dongia sp.]|uniref:hypothetical protein n=1 Tax=Dongia sp. TaxID=1977262 RepID=UPI0035B35136